MRTPDVDAISKLADGIVLQACVDYRKALVNSRKRPKRDDKEGIKAKLKALDTIDDCELFFKSEWFSMLTGIDGRWLMRKIREEALTRPWYQPDPLEDSK